MKHGKMTEQFGLWFTQYLQTKDQFSVFYDHGNPQEDSSVVVIKGFFGEKVTNRNRLTDADVMVVNNDREVVLLIEIEESRMSPKKLLGDIFSTVICNQFAVRKENQNEYFRLSTKTVLIIAGIVPNPGDQEDELDKIRNIVMPRLQKVGTPKDMLQIGNIRIVTDKDISKTLERLKKEVTSIFEIG
jgi:hypothetical protein